MFILSKTTLHWHSSSLFLICKPPDASIRLLAFLVQAELAVLAANKAKIYAVRRDNGIYC